MPGGRAKLPVLAEISGPVAGVDRAWSLRREDLERLVTVRERLDGRQAVLVTGADERIGVLAVALAALAAAAGRRTALLECDLARPRLAADLGLSQSPGLHEYLRWEATPAEILQPLVLAGPASAAAEEPLVCIAAGRVASDPATLLGLQSFRHMTAKLRGAYDLLVIAGPAIAAGDGGLPALAAQSDALLAALTPAEQSGRENRELRSAIGRLPAAPLGAVVVNS
jgi:succinoglycan biosynthesis transport protein ExoP